MSSFRSFGAPRWGELIGADGFLPSESLRVVAAYRAEALAVAALSDAGTIPALMTLADLVIEITRAQGAERSN